MRLFLAFEFSNEQKQAIHEALRPFRDMPIPVRWVDPDRYHLTLKFLGQVPESAVPVLSAAISRVASATLSFPLNFTGVGAFPSIRLPETLWVGVDPTPALRCLKQDLEWGLVAQGFPREVRAFQPHITVGRADATEGAGAFRGLDTAVTHFKLDLRFPVESLSLVRSQQTREGRVFRSLAAAPLRVRGRRAKAGRSLNVE